MGGKVFWDLEVPGARGLHLLSSHHPTPPSSLARPPGTLGLALARHSGVLVTHRIVTKDPRSALISAGLIFVDGTVHFLGASPCPACGGYFSSASDEWTMADRHPCGVNFERLPGCPPGSSPCVWPCAGQKSQPTSWCRAAWDRSTRAWPWPEGRRRGGQVRLVQRPSPTRMVAQTPILHGG